MEPNSNEVLFHSFRKKYDSLSPKELALLDGRNAAVSSFRFDDDLGGADTASVTTNPHSDDSSKNGSTTGSESGSNGRPSSSGSHSKSWRKGLQVLERRQKARGITDSSIYTEEGTVTATLSETNSHQASHTVSRATSASSANRSKRTDVDEGSKVSGDEGLTKEPKDFLGNLMENLSHPSQILGISTSDSRGTSDDDGSASKEVVNVMKNSACATSKIAGGSFDMIDFSDIQTGPNKTKQGSKCGSSDDYTGSSTEYNPDTTEPLKNRIQSNDGVERSDQVHQTLSGSFDRTSSGGAKRRKGRWNKGKATVIRSIKQSKVRLTHSMSVHKRSIQVPRPSFGKIKRHERHPKERSESTVPFQERMKTMLNKKAQSVSTRRLTRDYRKIANDLNSTGSVASVKRTPVETQVSFPRDAKLDLSALAKKSVSHWNQYMKKKSQQCKNGASSAISSLRRSMQGKNKDVEASRVAEIQMYHVTTTTDRHAMTTGQESTQIEVSGNIQDPVETQEPDSAQESAHIQEIDTLASETSQQHSPALIFADDDEIEVNAPQEVITDSSDGERESEDGKSSPAPSVLLDSEDFGVEISKLKSIVSDASPESKSCDDGSCNFQGDCTNKVGIGLPKEIKPEIFSPPETDSSKSNVMKNLPGSPAEEVGTSNDALKALQCTITEKSTDASQIERCVVREESDASQVGICVERKGSNAIAEPVVAGVESERSHQADLQESTQEPCNDLGQEKTCETKEGDPMKLSSEEPTPCSKSLSEAEIAWKRVGEGISNIKIIDRFNSSKPEHDPSSKSQGARIEMLENLQVTNHVEIEPVRKGLTSNETSKNFKEHDQAVVATQKKAKRSNLSKIPAKQKVKLPSLSKKDDSGDHSPTRKKGKQTSLSKKGDSGGHIHSPKKVKRSALSKKGDSGDKDQIVLMKSIKRSHFSKRGDSTGQDKIAVSSEKMPKHPSLSEKDRSGKAKTVPTKPNMSCQKDTRPDYVTSRPPRPEKVAFTGKVCKDGNAGTNSPVEKRRQLSMENPGPKIQPKIQVATPGCSRLDERVPPKKAKNSKHAKQMIPDVLPKSKNSPPVSTQSLPEKSQPNSSVFKTERRTRSIPDVLPLSRNAVVGSNAAASVSTSGGISSSIVTTSDESVEMIASNGDTHLVQPKPSSEGASDEEVARTNDKDQDRPSDQAQQDVPTSASQQDIDLPREEAMEVPTECDRIESSGQLQKQEPATINKKGINSLKLRTLKFLMPKKKIQVQPKECHTRNLDKESIVATNCQVIVKEDVRRISADEPREGHLSAPMPEEETHEGNISYLPLQAPQSSDEEHVDDLVDEPSIAEQKDEFEQDGVTNNESFFPDLSRLVSNLFSGVQDNEEWVEGCAGGSVDSDDDDDDDDGSCTEGSLSLVKNEDAKSRKNKKTPIPFLDDETLHQSSSDDDSVVSSPTLLNQILGFHCHGGCNDRLATVESNVSSVTSISSHATLESSINGNYSGTDIVVEKRSGAASSAARKDRQGEKDEIPGPWVEFPERTTVSRNAGAEEVKKKTRHGVKKRLMNLVKKRSKRVGNVGDKKTPPGEKCSDTEPQQRYSTIRGDTVNHDGVGAEGPTAPITSMISFLSESGASSGSWTNNSDVFSGVLSGRARKHNTYEDEAD